MYLAFMRIINTCTYISLCVNRKIPTRKSHMLVKTDMSSAAKAPPPPLKGTQAL